MPDYLVAHLTQVPAFRALLRAVEARLLGRWTPRLKRPILDLGCGDGLFASVVFPEPVEVGLDPSYQAVAEAHRRGAYRQVVVAEGQSIPYPNSYFATVFSNCVLEHIRDVEVVLQEVHRVLRKEGIFLFSTPSEHFAEYLFFPTLLRRLRMRSLAQAYGRWFNRISKHYHTDGVAGWRERLEKAGFRILHWEPYMSPHAHWLFDLGHYYGAITLLYRKLLGRWLIAPWRWNVALLEWLLRRFYRERGLETGAYLFFVCKRGDGR